MNDSLVVCLAGEDGVPCHGNGECVDNTCVCYAGWTGKSDVLSYDGYDCMISWGITLAASLLLAFKAIKGAKNQVPAYLVRKKKLQAKGTTLQPWQFTPLLIVMLTMSMMWMPMTYATIKVAGMEDREIGRAWLPSVLFLLVSCLGFTTNIVSELDSFDLITKGSGLSAADRNKLRFYIKSRSIVTVVAYLGSTMVVLFTACSMPRTNPNVSVMRWLLIVRNMSFAIMTANIYFVNRTVRNEIDKLVKKMGAGSTANSASTESATKALEFMRHLSKEKAVSCTVGSLLMIIWCFPVMRPHQGYVMSLLTTLLFVKSHPIDITYKRPSSSNKVADAPASSAGSTKESTTA